MYSIQALKIISNLIAPLLCHLIYKYFSGGKFPDYFKIARVTQKYKSGERDLTSSQQNIREKSVQSAL